MPLLAAFPKGFFDAIVARQMTVFDWIEIAASLDLDGVELYPRFLDSFDSPFLARVRKAAEQRGLVIPMFCNSPDFTQPVTEDIYQFKAKTGAQIQVLIVNTLNDEPIENVTIQIFDKWKLGDAKKDTAKPVPPPKASR